MKFKYMIRGMGLGVIITAVIMGAYTRSAVADARVAVLKEYGLGEQSRLVEPGENLSEEPSAVGPSEQVILRDEEKESEINSVLDAAKDSEQADASGAESGELSSDAHAGEEASEPGADVSPAAIEGMPPDEGAPSSDTIDIVIASGDDSGTVARKLYNAGIIENASEYDAFLMQHGYDKRLTTGTKTISATDTWQDIADKITR